MNVTNLNSNETWITNLVNLTVALTNILYSSGGEDILAGNPWWSTNSGFNLDYYNLTRSGAYPSSPFGFYSFPQLVSLLSSTYYQPYFHYYPYDTSDFDRWGIGGANWKNGVYTFFDWLADNYKSNLVLNTSSSYSNLLAESVTYDNSDDSNPTNVPLPQYSLPASELISGSHDTLTSLDYDLSDKLDSLQPNYTGGMMRSLLFRPFRSAVLMYVNIVLGLALLLRPFVGVSLPSFGMSVFSPSSSRSQKRSSFIMPRWVNSGSSMYERP